MSRARVVVIGGGVAGLAAAWELTQRLPGERVVVLDASDRPGGKLRLERVAGTRIDVGAESMLARRPEGLALVEEIGAGALLTHPVTTAAGVWSRGSLHPLPKGTLMGIPGDPGRHVACSVMTRWLGQPTSSPGPRAVSRQTSRSATTSARGSAGPSWTVSSSPCSEACMPACRPPVPAGVRAWPVRGGPLGGQPERCCAGSRRSWRRQRQPGLRRPRGGMGRLPELLCAGLRERGYRSTPG